LKKKYLKYGRLGSDKGNIYVSSFTAGSISYFVMAILTSFIIFFVRDVKNANQSLNDVNRSMNLFTERMKELGSKQNQLTMEFSKPIKSKSELDYKINLADELINIQWSSIPILDSLLTNIEKT
jgi:hypothetical protein